MWEGRVEFEVLHGAGGEWKGKQRDENCLGKNRRKQTNEKQSDNNPVINILSVFTLGGTSIPYQSNTLSNRPA